MRELQERVFSFSMYALEIAKEYKGKEPYGVIDLFLSEVFKLGAHTSSMSTRYLEHEYVEAIKRAQRTYYFLKLIQQGNVLNGNFEFFIKINIEIIRILEAEKASYAKHIELKRNS